MVLDCEITGPSVGRYTPAEATVVRARDWGRTDAVLYARTHLGGLLKPGDVALGYDVASANLCDPELETYRGLQLPDVVLVRKSYAARRRARREKGGGAATLVRPWRLRRLAVAPSDSEVTAARRAGAEEEEEEAFLEEIEEDPELRARVALYKDRNADAAAAARAARAQQPRGDDSDSDEFPEVPLEELLDEMTLRSGGGGDGGDSDSGGDMED
jgi:nonsense-mediated mRNA decay protein 3